MRDFEPAPKTARETPITASAIIRNTTTSFTTRQATIQAWDHMGHIVMPSAKPTYRATTQAFITDNTSLVGGLSGSSSLR